MEEPKFLTLEIALNLHRESIRRFGGSHGLRDEGRLLAALAAAENAFYYRTGDVFEVAAAYSVYIAEGQPFSIETNAPPLPRR